ncbi:MAG: hypothetical protein CVV44_13960 [Spirochaetae bacterium HGW-Spirochaetae-1]|nr:MAG: hypothetical protein CVV44_13960 [Spirochaetae bacterium HGW-Spirochaetae-1]
MSGKELEKIVEYVDRIKGEWETQVSHRLYEYEKKSGLPLSEADEDIRHLLLQHMSWLQEDLRMLRHRLEGTDQIK